jgi:competence protein ComEA
LDTRPPWRILEASTEDAGPSLAGPDPVSDRPGEKSGWHHGLPFVRIAGTLAATVACGVVALALASSSGAGSTVVVDGSAPFASTRVTEGPGGDGAKVSDGIGSIGGLVVEVVGAVRHPGVYRLPVGARMGDAVDAAGGYSPRVDIGRAERTLNLASLIQDGDQVRVPSRDDPELAPVTPATGPSSGGSIGAAGPLDINTATAAELDALPGIGPVTTEKILAARDDARFTSVDDLRTRGLVGQKAFERIRSSLVVR